MNAVQRNESRAESYCKFQRRCRMETESEEDEFDGEWSRNKQKQHHGRDYAPHGQGIISRMYRSS